MSAEQMSVIVMKEFFILFFLMIYGIKQNLQPAKACSRGRFPILH